MGAHNYPVQLCLHDEVAAYLVPDDLGDGGGWEARCSDCGLGVTASPAVPPLATPDEALAAFGAMHGGTDIEVFWAMRRNGDA